VDEEEKGKGGEEVDIHSLWSKQGSGQGLVGADWLMAGGSCVHTGLGECWLADLPWRALGRDPGTLGSFWAWPVLSTCVPGY
jgi:hypothetical protein